MNCLEEYLEIFKKYPFNDKRLKKERNIALHSWRVDHSDYSLLKSELCRFIKENRSIINSVFIGQAVCPLVSDCLSNHEYDFINELIETIGIDESQKISLKDVIMIYCEYMQRKKSPIQMINEVLPYSNSNLLLKLKFRFMHEQIFYSIHELPVGIIETDSLSMQNYIDFFDEYEEIAEKLNEKTEIDKVKIVYDAYYDYLNNIGVYTSFEEYLNINHVDYACLFYRGA